MTKYMILLSGKDFLFSINVDLSFSKDGEPVFDTKAQDLIKEAEERVKQNDREWMIEHGTIYQLV